MTDLDNHPIPVGAAELRYKGPRFDVWRNDFEYTDGERVTREWMAPGDVVAVLPWDGTTFWLAEQPREVTGRTVLSLCAGKIDEGELAVEAADRELAEELGIQAERWEQIAAFYTSEGITDEHTTMFLATRLSRLGVSPGSGIGLGTNLRGTDLSERITVRPFANHAIDGLIRNADNAKLLIALQHLRIHMVNKELREIGVSHQEDGERLEELGSAWS